MLPWISSLGAGSPPPFTALRCFAGPSRCQAPRGMRMVGIDPINVRVASRDLGANGQISAEATRVGKAISSSSLWVSLLEITGCGRSAFVGSR